MPDEPSWDEIFRDPNADRTPTPERHAPAPSIGVAAAAEEARRAPSGAGTASTGAPTATMAPPPLSQSRRDSMGERPYKPRKKRRWGLLVVLLIFLAVVGGTTVALWNTYGERVLEFMKLSEPNDYEGSGNGEPVTIVIQSGQIGEDVARTLHDEGVTKTFDAFYSLLLKSPDVGFEPGNYQLQKQMSASSALAALQDPDNKIINKVTIPEGVSAKGSFALLAAATGLPETDFEAAAADPLALGVPAGAPTVEGFLFPATYTFDPGVTAQGVLTQMVSEMMARLDNLGVADTDMVRVVTMASIIQRESGPNLDDMYKISRVFQNRIDQGMNLQSDATVAYGTGNTDTVWTTDAERADASNLYNTYANPGLPVGPIGLPGETALDAAVHPADGPWLFFVPINLATGETVFSTTANEHEAAAKQLRAWCNASAENATYCE